MSRDVLDRQRAFTGLLRQPVLDRRVHAELWPVVRRHRSVLIDWFATRLGYRLVITDRTARLFRLPLAGTVHAPRRFRPPSRRVLVLALLAAAVGEDAEDVTTTQDLSDRVRVLSNREDVEIAAYDPDRFAERGLFVKAVELLISLGGLRPSGRDDEERREGWAHRRDAIGGAYEVQREPLLRLVEPAGLDAVLGGFGSTREPAEFAARYGVMRRLLELPVCLYDDLSEAERAYLSSQRHRILAWCVEMTGWTVEQRAEGMALIATDETNTDLPFPRLRASDFATVMLLDRLLAASQAAAVLDRASVLSAAGDVRAAHPRAMTKDLATDDAVADTALERLWALDLIRPVTGGWRLTPAAARFRNPRVVAVSQRLDSLEET